MYSVDDITNESELGLMCPVCSRLIENGFSTEPQQFYPRDAFVVTLVSVTCGHSFELTLPKLEKKLIYLDQWFISNAVASANITEFRRVAILLKRLVEYQSVAIITSDIHARESVNSGIESNKQERWTLLNDLALSEVSKHPAQIQAEQIVRMLLGIPVMLPWSDILYKNPHEWSLGMPSVNGARVRIITTNEWRMNLEEYLPNQEQMNAAFRNELETSVKIVGFNTTPQDCLRHCASAFNKQIAMGVEYYQRMERVHHELRRAEGELTSKLLSSLNIQDEVREDGQHMHMFIKNIIKKTISKGALSCEEACSKLKSCPASYSKTVHLAFDAQKLFSAVNIFKDSGRLTTNSKKFSRKFGYSYENDANHISYYAPYVDAMLVDNSAISLFDKEPLINLGVDLSCKFFSPSSLLEFETYLSSIVDSEPFSLRELKRLLGLDFEKFGVLP